MKIYIRISDTGAVSASTLPLEGHLHECELAPHSYDVRHDTDCGSTCLETYGARPDPQTMESLARNYEIPVEQLTVCGTFPEETVPSLL